MCPVRRRKGTLLCCILVLSVCSMISFLYINKSISFLLSIQRAISIEVFGRDYYRERWDQSTTRGSVLRHTPFSSLYVNRYLRYNTSTPTRMMNERHWILWWNAPSWMRNENVHNYCNLSLCEYSNCVVTQDRDLFKRSSAVIFSFMWGLSRVPIARSKRNPDQAWVFYNMEPPIKFFNRDAERPVWVNTFNWSMMYRTDADIFTPYGLLVDTASPLVRNYSEIFHKKTKLVAWVVSNCKTDGLREEYIKTLQTYIQVDVYGSCGTKLNDAQLDKILDEYKFYLGFENSFCKDYVTEKFFKYIQRDFVIIVRGSPDYGKLFPNNSFINAADFSSIKQLGQYLSYLAVDEAEYTRYLETKDQYTVLSVYDMYCDGLCTLCEKVNNIDGNRRTYGNVFDWTDKTECEQPNDLILI